MPLAAALQLGHHAPVDLGPMIEGLQHVMITDGH